MIKLDHIFFSYDNICALKDISLLINDNESIALKGPNGCGKSTLLKLLNGIIFPTKGDYFFNEYQITKNTMKDNKLSKYIHQKIGFVFQNPDTQLFCGNVYEEIAFGPRQMGFSEDIVKRRTEDCLELLEINNLRNRAPYHLSGGEKRKVAIASVLSLNPSILMLDEPLNGLDSDSQEWLVKFLITLKNSHKTILLSTHDEYFAHTVCDKSIEINKNHELVDIDYLSYKRIKEV